MQNLLVTLSQPSPSTPLPGSPDNNAPQPSESFGNVLARQCSNANAAQSTQQTNNQQANNQQTTSPASNDAPAAGSAQSASAANQNGAGNAPGNVPNAPQTTGTSHSASKDKAKTSVLTATTDASGTLPGNMLAMFQPTSTAAKDKSALLTSTPDGLSSLLGNKPTVVSSATLGTDSTTGKSKSTPLAPTSDGVSAMPADMLAMMMPASAANSRSAVGDKGVAGASSASADITSGLQSSSATALGKSLQLADKRTVTDIPTGAASSAAETGKDSTFATTLATMGKDTIQTLQLDTGAAKIAAQQPASNDSQMQNALAAISGNQVDTTPPLQVAINTPVTHEAWGNDFNQKITWMATQHNQTAELHLNPPNLGPLDVVLKVSGDQATALFTSPHAAVREAVQQALPQLRDMMANNGITLGNAMVSDQSPKDQQAWQSEQRQKGNGGAAGRIETSMSSGSLLNSNMISMARRHQGMVDTFA